ncbi:MAG: deaminase [Promethearchaeota archaeon]
MDLDTIIQEAIRQSKKTKYVFRLGAVVFNRHRILGAGYNRVFSKGGKDNQGDCAEVLAIKKAPSKYLDGATILVCRVNNSGSFGMSKPCGRCMKLIAKSGIKKVIFSTPDGWKELDPNEQEI